MHACWPTDDMAAHAAGERRQVSVHLFDLGEDLARVAQQRLSRTRERRAPACQTLEQRCAQTVFEQAQAMASPKTAPDAHARVVRSSAMATKRRRSVRS